MIGRAYLTSQGQLEHALHHAGACEYLPASGCVVRLLTCSDSARSALCAGSAGAAALCACSAPGGRSGGAAGPPEASMPPLTDCRASNSSAVVCAPPATTGSLPPSGAGCTWLSTAGATAMAASARGVLATGSARVGEASATVAGPAVGSPGVRAPICCRCAAPGAAALQCCASSLFTCWVSFRHLFRTSCRQCGQQISSSEDSLARFES